MNRSSRRLTKKQARQKARRLMSAVHILIAVVAIVECILLSVFTTFSWIESNSSLVIQNGPASTQVDTGTTKKMDIAPALNSTINLNYTSGTVPGLNTFYSAVKYFQFAKATSSDGVTMFFPCRNNTYSTAGKYRKGDTIDYNTSYLYFDFILSNSGSGAANRDVYFSNESGFTDIFTVDGGDLNSEQQAAVRKAMRMSITTKVGNSAANTTIYSENAYSGTTAYNPASPASGGSYKSFSRLIPADQSYAYDVTDVGAGTTNERTEWVNTKALSKSVYATESNVITADKLFVVKKNVDTKVSIRIWFDVFDPVFRSVFGLDDSGFSYSSTDSAYSKLPDATVGIKFKLLSWNNDLRSVYFDDYTFSNNGGIGVTHLTDEPDSDGDPSTNYSVWFYAYQPGVSANATTGQPARTAGYFATELVRESSGAGHTRWSTNLATASMMQCLMNDNTDGHANAAGHGASEYTHAYFCYGDFATKTAVYKWALPSAPVSDGDFTFNAYSYLPNSSTDNSGYTWVSSSIAEQHADCGIWKTGVGIWQDDTNYTAMELLKFRDKATAATASSYNTGSNYKIMNAAAEADDHTHYLVYANNYNNATAANNFTASGNQTINLGSAVTTTLNAATVENRTAAMYYDSANKVFMSYVPRYWITGDASDANKGVSFTYCPGGTFSNNAANIRWYNSAPAPLSTGEYMFTALGSSNVSTGNGLTNVGFVADYFNNTAGFLKGYGTWGDIELIKFNTELIDSDLDADYRYYIDLADTYSEGCYVMVPDDTNMTFSAYIPSGTGSTLAAVIGFVRYDAVKQTSSSSTIKEAEPAAYWYAAARHNSYTTDYSTFYPVDCDGDDATVETTHGYWNLSVLVDATYENFIYDTLTDGTAAVYDPIVTTGDAGTDGSVDYSPRGNYGLLEYSYDNSTWYTLADDTADTLNNMIDRYRFYVSAEDRYVVYWRWTPYKGYTVTFYSGGVSQTITADDTVFVYTHDVADASSTGIYKVVVEAPYMAAGS